MLELTLVSVEARTAGGEVPTDIPFGRPRSHVELICPPTTTLASTLRLSEGDFRTVTPSLDVLECALIGITLLLARMVMVVTYMHDCPR